MKWSLEHAVRARTTGLILIAAAWVLFMISLKRPGLYYRGDAWFRATEIKTLWVLIIPVLSIGTLGDSPAGAGLIASGLALAWGTLHLLLAPVVIMFIRRPDWIRGAAYAGLGSLMVWLVPAFVFKPNNGIKFLSGYYLLAISMTLASLATAVCAGIPSTKSSGFSPLISANGRS